MNNLQPYEKHLADRLQQVPVPDKDEGWKEMRKLLDRDLPEGGTGWSGNRRWWWMGLTVAIIITGLWMSQQINRQSTIDNRQSLVGQQDGADNRQSTIRNRQSIIDNQPSQNPKSPNQQSQNQQSTSATNIHSSGEKETKQQENFVQVDNTTAVTLKPNDKGTIGNKLSTGSSISSDKTGVGKRAQKNGKGHNIEVMSTATVTQGQAIKSGRNNNNKSNVDLNSSSISNADGIRQGNDENSLKTASYFFDASEEPPVNSPAEIFGVSTLSQDPLRAVPGKTDKAFAKDMRKKSIADDSRKMSRKNMRGVGREKDRDLTFAAGLSLPQSFAIGSQQSPSYGVNAKPGTVSDYVPVPYFQYHVNNRLFVQTELQFQAPQFTDRLLVSQSQRSIAPTNGMLERNIYVEKLYYFHIPLNVYFSPIRNFYVGSGLQYSSLLSGVATYQDNRYVNGNLENSATRVQGFKDDSVASKLAPSEWRYQFDANYYFKRFTLGGRYNQALSQFANLRPSPTLPVTQGRNQSFLIYLRYNIWEEKKKSSYYTNSW